MKKTRRKIMISLVCILMTLVTLLGSTYAWFTDSVSNTGNRIQAGTLDIGLYQYKDKTWVDISGDGQPVFDSDKWEPGYSEVALLKVNNDGNLALKFELKIKGGDNNAIEINENNHSLADVIYVYSKIGATSIPTSIPEDSEIDNTDATKWHKNLLSDVLFEAENAASGYLIPNVSTDAENPTVGSYATMAVILHMDEEAGNEYQNLALGTDLDIVLEAKQYTSELDGFGSNQYDATADGTPDHSEFDQTSVLVKTTKYVVPVEVSSSGIITAKNDASGNPIVVSNEDMTVTYTKGAILKSDTNHSEETADATIGFEYKSDDSKLGLTLEDDQSVKSYELTLNIDEDKNETLVKITKNIGTKLEGLKVYHGNTTPLTKLEFEATIPTDNTKEYYYYNSESGIVTLWLLHASPVEFVSNTPSWAVFAASDFATPVDTTKKIVTIASAEELALYQKTASNYNGYTINLTADIDLGAHAWNPISISEGTVFDGGNHTISNVYVKGEKKVGLFGASSCSTIKNLTVDGAEVTGINHVAAITGYAICCNIENCHVKNAVITTNVKNNDDGDKAGAIVGYFTCEGNGHVSGCSAEDCIVTGYRDIGALIGYTGCYNTSTSENAYVTGNSVKNCKVYCDNSVDYQNYKTKEDNTLATAYDVNALIGDTTDDTDVATHMDVTTGNTVTGTTVEFKNN